MIDVFGLGCINQDLICLSSGDREKAGILKLTRYPGGSALNTISWLAKLGFSTGFLGVVGSDPWGSELIGKLKQRGINLICRILDGPSGLAIGIVEPQRGSRLYVYPGVNSRLRIGSSELELLSSAELVHMEGLITRSQLKMQFQLARKLETKLSFAPGMSCFHFPQLVSSIASECDYLIANHLEAQALKLDSVQQVTAITYPDGCQLRIPGRAPEFIRIGKVHVLDSIGAGDAFAAGFLAGILRKIELRSAASLGLRLARICLRFLGAFPERLERLKLDYMVAIRS